MLLVRKINKFHYFLLREIGVGKRYRFNAGISYRLSGRFNIRTVKLFHYRKPQHGIFYQIFFETRGNGVRANKKCFGGAKAALKHHAPDNAYQKPFQDKKKDGEPPGREHQKARSKKFLLQKNCERPCGKRNSARSEERRVGKECRS